MIALSHIALACPEMAEALRRLQSLGLDVAERHDVPTEKVKVGMIPVTVSEHFRLELLEATSSDSPIAKFLTRNPKGGIHHLCFAVKSLETWKKRVEEAGLEVLPPGIRVAARGKAFFIHPKSMSGVLIELEEIGT